MKKIIFIASLMLLFSLKIKAEELNLVNYGNNAIMIEPLTNTIIYKKNENERKAPASMTKLMTMLLIMEAIDNKKISFTDEVLVSKNSSQMGGSTIFLEENMKISVLELLKGIAIASGNDAAVAMAEYIAGSTSSFVEMMNNKAKKLGLENTHFMNVHGLDEDNHYSSAYDMSQIARELIKYPKILEFTSLYEDYLTRPDGTKTWLVNTNKLVRFYDGVDGLKTGYTDNARYCLTSTAKKNNTRFITVVMDADTSEHRNSDTTSLLNYGFNTYKLEKIYKKNDIIQDVKINNAQEKNIKAIITEDVFSLNKINENNKYKYNIRINKLTAPVNKGEVIGTIEIINQRGKVIKISNLTVNKIVKKHTILSIFIRNLKQLLDA